MAWRLSGCLQDGCDHQLDAALIDPGEGIPKVDRQAVARLAATRSIRSSPLDERGLWRARNADSKRHNTRPRMNKPPAFVDGDRAGETD